MTPTGTHVYQATSIPDVSDLRLSRRFGGEVSAVAVRAEEALLHELARQLPRRASVWVTFLYEPAHPDPKQRLRLELVIRGRVEAANRLARSLEASTLMTLYALKRIGEGTAVTNDLSAACVITRHQELLPTATGKKFNPLVAEAYYCAAQLDEADGGRSSTLDTVLHQCRERVVVVIGIQPVPVRRCQRAILRYQAKLEKINRSYDPPQAMAFEPTGRQQALVVEPNRQRDPAAEQAEHRIRWMTSAATPPNLGFFISVLAPTLGTARAVAEKVGHGALHAGSFDLHECRQGDGVFEPVLDAVRYGVVHRFPAFDLVVGRHAQRYAGLAPLATSASVAELLPIVCLPVAHEGPLHCSYKSTDPPPLPSDHSLVLGRSEAGSPLGIPYDKLCCHALVLGGTGSGKTNAVRGWVVQLRKAGFRVLVIDPAKFDHATIVALQRHPDALLRQIGQETQVYTLSTDTISPFRFNPLSLPLGMDPEAYIEFVLKCFEAAMPLGGPLRSLLREALRQVYRDYPDPSFPPILKDLERAAWEVLARTQYDGEVKANLTEAIQQRLGALTKGMAGRIFACRKSTPTIEQLIGGLAVLEMRDLAPDIKCLVTLFLLTAIRLRLQKTAHTPGEIRLAIVLEELHNLVGRHADARPSEVNADPKSYATEMISQLVLEARALGVCMALVDQHPTNLAAEVVKAPATMLVLRQKELADRQMAAEAMAMDTFGYEHLSRLRTGEAYLYTDGFYRAELVHLTHWTRQLQLPEEIQGSEVRQLIQTQPWFIQGAIERTKDQLLLGREAVSQYETEKLKLHAELRRVIRRQLTLTAIQDGSRRRAEQAHMVRTVGGLRQRWSDRLRDLTEGFCQQLASVTVDELQTVAEARDLLEARRLLIEHSQNVLVPQALALDARLKQLLEKWTDDEDLLPED